MSITPQYDSYRYVGEIGCFKSQSIVECRLPGSEVSGILAIHAKATPTEVVCADGEVSYGGKLLLNVVYEDGEKKICRAERGAEFYHKAENKDVTPACFAKILLSAENISYRREGSGLYVSVIVNATIMVYGGKQMEYLSGGENVVTKKENVSLYRTVCVLGEAEDEDEFETDYVGDILLHSENAVVSRVTSSSGEIEIEGEIHLNICVLKSDESVGCYERVTPFKMQIPSEEAFLKAGVRACVDVKTSQLFAGSDEEKGKSKIVFSYALSALCFVSVKEEISLVQDAFALSAKLDVTHKKEIGRYVNKHVKCVERVSGVAAMNPSLEGEYVLQAAVLPRAEIVCKKTENGVEAEGVVFADVLLCGADGTHRSVALSLPFAFPLDVDGDEVEADCVVCGLNVRRKKNGETEAEATLKLSIWSYEVGAWSYVMEAKALEAYPKNESAFSVFIPKAGEGLWEVAKRLSCPVEDVQRSNPDLEFPLKEGKRIFIYRQIRS